MRLHPSPRRLALRALLTVVAVLVPLAHAHAQAQATTGVIRGVITDSAGNALDGVTVTLRNIETNATRQLLTNGRGTYVASLLRVGTWDVTARQLGYAERTRRGIVLRLGEVAEADFALARVAVTLTGVQVSGTAVPTDVSRSQSSTLLDANVVAGLPNNGRNVLALTTLAPNVAITQGPDGDVISIGGQKGIHNNVSVDGADFNNPFFGEQRGGQRPAFTFNLDAVQDFVVVSQGANAEFGRSSGGFVNVITKSGTNQVKGTAHYYGQDDALSANFARGGGNPDFRQHQAGFTLGGPIVRDRAFFFVAYDQQVFDQTKQTNGARFDPLLRSFVDTAFGGALRNDYGPIARTNDAQAALAKVDVRLNERHTATLKYNFTRSRQENGTFDVDTWGRSANGSERDFSNALNGQLVSLFGSSVNNEFRFQLSREDRPRPYAGPINPATGRPFPDTGADFGAGYRFGMPFFLPVDAFDDRIQVLDNLSVVRGDHLFKVGGEWNRTRVKQTFQGFGNGRIIFSSVPGFLNYVARGPGYVECSDNSSSNSGSCPAGTTITGPVLLYLQQAGLGGRSVAEAGTQEIVQNELALFVQDSWKATPKLTLNYGLRWEAQIQPDAITDPNDVFFSDLIGRSVTNGAGTFRFPSNGKIPSDYGMFQPRFGFAYDVNGNAKQVVRGSAGLYYARIPGLVLAGTRNTNGSIGQTIFRNSALTGILGAPPAYGALLPVPTGGPFRPDITVTSEDFRNPRTFSASLGYERELFSGVVAGLSHTYAKTDFLTRFVNRNDAVFGAGDGSGPFSTGIGSTGNGVGTLTVVEATAKSQYNGTTVELKRTVNPALQFQVNYTLSFDKSSDDNERDPFTFRYARADRLDREYGYSDRDQRHRLNAWFLYRAPGMIYLNNRISTFSATPASAKCVNNAASVDRANTPQERICTNGTILERNTIRKDNGSFTWDLRASRPFPVGGNTLELIAEVFNITNADNFRDPSVGSPLFNFDGTVRSGLGDPRRMQLGLRYVF